MDFLAVIINTVAGIVSYNVGQLKPAVSQNELFICFLVIIIIGLISYIFASQDGRSEYY